VQKFTFSALNCAKIIASILRSGGKPMNFTKVATLTLSLLIALSGGIFVSALEASAKPKVTITMRIERLSKKIDKGQKSNELTLKEAEKLRGEIADINAKIEKAKEKNGGKLSYEDETKMEKELNKVSVGITKKSLNKRTSSPD